MKYLSCTLLLLLSVVTAGAQTVKDGTRWTDGQCTYIAKQRSDRCIRFEGITPHEGGYEFLLKPVDANKGEYTLYAEESDYTPMAGEIGDRVQHLRQDGIDALVVRNDAGRATDILVRDNLGVVEVWERDLTTTIKGPFEAKNGDVWIITDKTVQHGRSSTPVKLRFGCIYDMPQNIIIIDGRHYKFYPSSFGFNVYPCVINEDEDDMEITGAGRSYYWSDSSQSRFSFLSERVCNLQVLGEFDTPTLRIMRNDIMARHGYVFQSKDLRDHFAKQPWYKPGTDNNAIRLSTIEQLNVELIQSLEKFRKENEDDITVDVQQPLD